MFFQSLKLIVSGIYKYVIPLSFTAIIFLQWGYLMPNELRILMSCAVILFVRIENSFAIYRFYQQKSAYEYEITILLGIVKIVNSLQTSDQPINIFYVHICDWFFNLFLLLNLSTYIGAFLIILLFALIVIVGLIRGDLEYINIRGGLNQQELSQLLRKEWSEFKKEQSVQDMRQSQEIAQNDELCPICLMKFESEEIVVQLPKCNHFFHGQCIDEWLQVQPICPFCRNNIRLAQLNL